MQGVMHAHLHFFERGREIDVSWEIINGIATENNEQLDRTTFHFIN